MARVELIQFPGAGRLESVSPFCVKVQRVLNYKRVPYVVRDVTIPPRRSLNPAGKLPVLRYDSTVIPDSTRIALALEERHPHPPLVPAAPEVHAHAQLLEDWADESLYWMLLYLRWKFPGNAARMRRVFAGQMAFPLSLLGPPIVERRIRRALHAQGTGRLGREAFLGALRRALAALDALAARADFLAGESLTLGDVAVFAMLNGMREAPLPHGVGEVDAFPALLGWYARVAAATARTP